MLTLDEIASNKTEWEKFIKELNEYMKRIYKYPRVL